MPRAERLAAVSAQLQEHGNKLRDQGIATRLLTACEELLSSDFDGRYFPRPPFGISRRDLRFQSIWNHVRRRSPLPRAVDFEHRPNPLAAFVGFARQLRERGIEFLLVPIPRPPQIYPERMIDDLAAPPDFVGADPGVSAFLTALVERDVEVLHLTPHFAAARESLESTQDRYLFHDWNNHWTPRAVELTADLVAERVMQMEGFEAGPLRFHRDWRREHHKITYDVPPPEGTERIQAEVWVDSILDDAMEDAHRVSRSSSILLLGDSNSRWYKDHAAELSDQLFARLGQHLDVIALAGAPADAYWKSLERRRGEGGLADKRVVIWVFAANMFLDEKLVPQQLFPD